MLLLQGETLWLLPLFFIIPISCKVWYAGAGDIRAHYTWTVINAWLFMLIETNAGHGIQWPVEGCS